jgi:hypothetical protein
MPIEINPAEEYDVPARMEVPCLQIRSMEPFRMREAATIGKNNVENAAARPRLDDAAAIHARVDGSLLTYL